MSKTIIYSAFIKGVLYIFGLNNNPIKEFKIKFESKNDNEAISKDWENIGIEIKKAFDVETKQAS